MKKTEEYRYLIALASGDTNAYELLFLWYQPKLVYFLTGFIHDEEQARDMAQDIFLSIWNQREKLSGITSFSGYIFCMARNALCNYYDHFLVREKYDAHQFFQPQSFNCLEEEIFANELQELINLSVELMPEQRKRIFRMSRIEGRTNDEIASQLTISKRTVENHLTAALADLRKVIHLSMIFF